MSQPLDVRFHNYTVYLPAELDCQRNATSAVVFDKYFRFSILKNRRASLKQRDTTAPLLHCSGKATYRAAESAQLFDGRARCISTRHACRGVPVFSISRLALHKLGLKSSLFLRQFHNNFCTKSILQRQTKRKDNIFIVGCFHVSKLDLIASFPSCFEHSMPYRTLELQNLRTTEPYY